jgi:lysyl-tRNA synthetase class 2
MPQQIDFSPPYPSLDFIPAIETAIGRSLPNLTSPEAKSELLALFNIKGITPPSSPTVPRLLDKLSSSYLEPQCDRPTWIINHPECLSPLSKSFNHPNNQQRVAARAELFVKKQELVNTYEEENSPMAQRWKFVEQLYYHASDLQTGVNESYLQALEWGLPPTGGWGCGIDRLCMLFAGTERIADVLSFGTLRNVVARRQSSKIFRRVV